MLWDQELKALAQRKRLLMAESEPLRAQVRLQGAVVAGKFHWMESLSRVGGYIRPALMTAAALVGYRRVSKRSRVLGIFGAVVALLRGALRLFRRG